MTNPDWIDYQICDGVAVMDRNNPDAWLECNNPLEVRR